MSDEKKLPEEIYARYCERHDYWEFDEEPPDGCIEKGCRCGSCRCECPCVDVKVVPIPEEERPWKARALEKYLDVSEAEPSHRVFR